MLNILFGIYLVSTIIAIVAWILTEIKYKVDLNKKCKQIETTREKVDKEMLENGWSEVELRKIHENRDSVIQKETKHWIDKIFEFARGVFFLFTPILNTFFAIHLIFNHQAIVDNVVRNKMIDNYVELRPFH